jgi:hypothetical protein
MRSIYRLQDATDKIQRMQAASTGSGQVGMKITHGLVGTSDWWSNIENGTLPLCTVVGTVSDLYLGQFDDGPAEFKMILADGTSSSWLCEVEPLMAKVIFKVGSKAEVDYVVQELKHPWRETPFTDLTIEIRVDLTPGAECKFLLDDPKTVALKYNKIEADLDFIPIGSYIPADADLLLGVFQKNNIRCDAVVDDQDLQQMTPFQAAYGGKFGSGIMLRISVAPIDLDLAIALREKTFGI